ncbi:MAG: carbonic anhydrase [Flavobacteriaceae bacterium]|nr:carbonic anhydrase [Flavobacteriaceae bacterium]PHX83482.1 MAG: carbonic anhydrase [Flavobacteriales bacterium]
MRDIDQLLLANKAWSEGRRHDDPQYFDRLSSIQAPKYLWIGCSDSRVPADTITGTAPGEIFVHRNIANMVLHIDLNMLSVLEYAVHYLKVEHVIVCGHYGCGGVAASLTNNSFGIINKWLRGIKDVHRLHSAEIDVNEDPTERVNRLVEFNVREQVQNLAKTSVIQRAWKERKAPTLHGWVYGLNDGLINPLCELQHDYELDPLYRFDNLD